jgi:hypothetical protein
MVEPDSVLMIVLVETEDGIGIETVVVASAPPVADAPPTVTVVVT